jgi:hypothetical protein
MVALTVIVPLPSGARRSVRMACLAPVPALDHSRLEGRGARRRQEPFRRNASVWVVPGLWWQEVAGGELMHERRVPLVVLPVALDPDRGAHGLDVAVLCRRVW